ncbi:hypothetical protein KIH86_07640, partial [Paenibacillus sp. HN-1]
MRLLEIFILLSFVLTFMIIGFERNKFIKIKKQLEDPLERILHTQYLIHEEESTKLIRAYTFLYNDSRENMKELILKLKFLKESKTKDQGLEDLLKMVS